MSHNTCWGWVNTYTSTHIHGESGATELVCVSVFVYTRGRGEMFLAKAQSGIRRLSLPRTSLTLFCLFLAAMARVNHSAASLAIAEKLPQAAAKLLSAHYVNKTPYCVGVGGHAVVQLQASGGAQEEESSSHIVENNFSNVWKRRKKRHSCSFSQSQAKEECTVTLDNDLERIQTDGGTHSF